MAAASSSRRSASSSSPALISSTRSSWSAARPAPWGAGPTTTAAGTAVADCEWPGQVVVATRPDDAVARAGLRGVFEPLLDASDAAVVETGIAEAEMIKYANNAFLASKVSLINDIGNVCKQFGVDAYEVADAVGLDDRIGERFLRSGLGWGGSCLTGDQRILAKDETGTRHLTLGEFFDEYVSDGTVDDVSVLSRSEQGEFAFKPVEVATRRRYDGPLHTIRTKMNKRVTVTHDHPMITLKGNDTAVKPAA